MRGCLRAVGMCVAVILNLIPVDGSAFARTHESQNPWMLKRVQHDVAAEAGA